MSKTFYKFSPFTREYRGTITPIDSNGEVSHYPSDATTIAPHVDLNDLSEDEVLIFHPVEGWIVEKKEIVKEKALQDLIKEKNIEHHSKVLHKGWWYDLIISPITLEYLLLAYMSREMEITLPVRSHTEHYTEVKVNRREFEDLMDTVFRGIGNNYLQRIRKYYTTPKEK